MHRLKLLALLLPFLLLAGCDSFIDEYEVRNETSRHVLFRVESRPCDQVTFFLVNNWSVIAPGSSSTARDFQTGEGCLVVRNVEQSAMDLIAFEDGGTFVVRQNSAGRLEVSRPDEVEVFAPSSSNAGTSRFRADDVSPKLLWVIGLPAALSAVYLSFVLGSFVLGPGKGPPAPDNP